MVLGGSECSVLSPILNEPQGPDPMWRPGNTVSLELGLGSPQTPALHHQSPRDRPLGVNLGLVLAPGSPADAS